MPASSSKTSTAIGVALSMTAALVNSTGLNLQRYGKKNSMPLLNALGIFMSAICGVLDMCSFYFAPQSLLAPIGSLALVFNLILARYLHKEKVARADVIPTVFIFCGTLICLSFGTSAKLQLSLDELVGLFHKDSFYYYALCEVSVIVVLASFIFISERAGKGSLKSVAVCYPVVSGMLGGCTVLSARTLGDVMGQMESFYDHRWMLLMIIVLLATSAVTQVSVLNRGLGRHSSLLVVPVFCGTFITSNIVSGGVVYNEFARITWLQMYAYLIGMTSVVCGVLYMAIKDSDKEGKK